VARGFIHTQEDSQWYPSSYLWRCFSCAVGGVVILQACFCMPRGLWLSKKSQEALLWTPPRLGSCLALDDPRWPEKEADMISLAQVRYWLQNQLLSPVGCCLKEPYSIHMVVLERRNMSCLASRNLEFMFPLFLNRRRRRAVGTPSRPRPCKLLTDAPLGDQQWGPYYEDMLVQFEMHFHWVTF
jgi:hypothetical protein